MSGHDAPCHLDTGLGRSFEESSGLEDEVVDSGVSGIRISAGVGHESLDSETSAVVQFLQARDFHDVVPLQLDVGRRAFEYGAEVDGDDLKCQVGSFAVDERTFGVSVFDESLCFFDESAQSEHSAPRA